MKSMRVKGLTILCVLCMLLSAVAMAETAPLTTAILPLTEDPVTFTIWTEFGNTTILTGEGDRKCWEEMEKRTNVHIEWISPPAGEGREKFNLLFATDDLPDAIESNYPLDLYPGGLDQGIADGYFLRLNELIDEYAPNFNHIRTLHDEIRRNTTTDQGNVAMFADVQPDEAPPWFGLIMRKDYLDQVGMEKPVTIEDWYNVLSAFKNDLQIEYPLLLNRHNWADDLKFASLFIGAWDVGGDIYQIDDQILFGPIQPEYKDCLTELNKWYAEGLIDPDFTTRSADSRNELMLNGKVGALNNNDWSRFHNGIQLAGNGELCAVQYPALTPDQKVHIRQWDGYYKGDPAVITSACENPELLVKWYDYHYTEDGMLLLNFGLENDSYELIDEPLSWDPIWAEFAPQLWNSGKTPVFTDKINSDPTGLDFYDAINKYRPHVSTRLLYFRCYEPEPGCFGEGRSVEWCKADSTYVAKGKSFTAEEQIRYNELRADIDTYCDEMIDKYIMGTESLDTYDEFIAQLQAMGVDEMISIYQTAYARFMSR